MISVDEALAIILRSVNPLEAEKTGIINSPGRTLAVDVLAAEDTPDGFLKAGELALHRGVDIGPAEMGLLAAAGIPGVAVTRRPRVSIVTTGNELIDMIERPERGKVRNSNRYGLAGRVYASGGDIGRLIHVKDDPQATRRAIESALTADAVVTTGGASEGSHGLVSKALLELGEVVICGVAARPMENLTFAILGGKPVFALPGNPEGAAIAFEVCVRPGLSRMLGRRQVDRPVVDAILVEGIPHDVGIREYAPGIVATEDGCLSVRRSNLYSANCLVIAQEGQADLRAGDKAEVMVLGSIGRS